jgi:hypothetical protein
VFGAPTHGAGKFAVGGYLGFPLVAVRAQYGVTDWLDLGGGLDSFYGVMNELRALGRVRLFAGEGLSAAAIAEVGYAFFGQPPEQEGRGARWITGRRNLAVEPGLVLAFQGSSARSARLFVDVRYSLSVDTQPISHEPLSGVPPPVTASYNLPFRFGAELPFSPTTAFLFSFGFDVHGRREDSAFMPSIAVGLVSGR